MRWFASLSPAPSARYRLGVASRVLASIVGGYALTSALASLLALLLPLSPRSEAVEAAVMVSFAIYAAILIWVFRARSATRVWAWLTLWTLVASALCWWIMRHGGGL